MSFILFWKPHMAARPQLQATNHFFQPKFISFSFLKRNVGWKEGLWASWGKMVMDVWPKVRERPSDSTFILESHACLSPPLDVHSFSQLALPCGAEYFSFYLTSPARFIWARLRKRLLSAPKDSLAKSGRLDLFQARPILSCALCARAQVKVKLGICWLAHT